MTNLTIAHSYTTPTSQTHRMADKAPEQQRQGGHDDTDPDLNFLISTMMELRESKDVDVSQWHPKSMVLLMLKIVLAGSKM